MTTKTGPEVWHGELAEENIEKVAAMIRARLEGKTFSVESVYSVNRPSRRREVRPGCRFEAEWADGSKESVRVMRGAGGSRWIAFTAGRTFWTFNARERGGAQFSFDRDGFEVEACAPCGDCHRHRFRAEG